MTCLLADLLFDELHFEAAGPVIYRELLLHEDFYALRCESEFNGVFGFAGVLHEGFFNVHFQTEFEVIL